MSIVTEYPKSVKVLRRIIKRHGELTAYKFDSLFGESELIVSDGITEIGGEIYPRGISVHQRKPYRYRLINKELNSGEYILGGWESYGDWGKWLDILQAMVVAGMVNTENREGVIVYTWANDL